MSRFKQTDHYTMFLMPPSLEDWLPENHLARFVMDIVAQLDLRAIKGTYEGRGSAAHNPEMLLGLLFYGYSTGVFASRKIERATYDSVAFRYIAGNTHPDHDTICTFRKRFLDQLKPLFLQILTIAHAIPEEIARRQDRLVAIAKAKEEIKRRADERYLREKQEYDDKMQKRQESGKKRGKEPAPPQPGPQAKDQVNLTDPESRIMPNASKGFEQAYNAQAAVDVDSMLIVASHISQNPNDRQEIKPALMEVAKLPGEG